MSHLRRKNWRVLNISTVINNYQSFLGMLGFVLFFWCDEAELQPDLLEVSSLQRLVSHLTEVHVTIVMALFPLQHTHTHSFF